uniref:Secreted protein n=1 Tax=Loa loa TaxID=7209 RepID=A0A1I7VQX2_LOALO
MPLSLLFCLIASANAYWPQLTGQMKGEWALVQPFFLGLRIKQAMLSLKKAAWSFRLPNKLPSPGSFSSDQCPEPPA